MKRTLELTLISALLFSTTVGAQVSLLSKANFVASPANPEITVVSPTNRTYNINTLTLEVQFYTYKTGFPGGPDSDNTRLFTYALDGKNPENFTILAFNVASYPGGDVSVEGLVRPLPELAEGLHNLTVRVVFVYDNPSAEGYIVGGIHTESESTVYFRIDTVPQHISIMMPENSTYLPTEVPLQFLIGEPASWMGYSLDGQDNITVAGNMTLPLLSVGQHALTMYANDVSGNPAASEPITFTVAEPSPPEPTTTFPTEIVLTASGASVAVVGIGLLFYFRRRKTSKRPNDAV